MSRILLYGLVTSAVGLAGCQQEKIGSQPTPTPSPGVYASAPPQRVPGPPGFGPPPPGPGVGPGVIMPPPGNPPPPPPGFGPGPGPQVILPPPSTPPPVTPTPGTPGLPPTQPPITTPNTPPPTVVSNPPPINPIPQPVVVPNFQPPPTVNEWNDIPTAPLPMTPPPVVASNGNPTELPPVQVQPQPLPPPPPPMQKLAPQPRMPVMPPPVAQQPVQPPVQVPPQPRMPVQQPVVAPPTPKPIAQQPVQPVAPPAPVAQPGTCNPVDVTERKPMNPQLDVLFVVDASASLRAGPRSGKLGQLAREMKYFVRSLDPNTDYHIAVIPGHGDPVVARRGAADNFHGKLFSTGASDPAVIESEKIRSQCKNNVTCVEDKMTSILEKKMAAIPRDHSGADGETLLLSLYDGLSKDSLRREIERQGMLRTDATLNVLIISDEQDGCFDYDTAPLRPDGSKIVPATIHYHDHRTGKIMTGQDPSEISTLNVFCKKAINGRAFQPADLLAELQKLKGDRLALSAVVYTNNKTIPRTPNGPDTEGHGFLELMTLATGQTVDMAGGIHGSELNFSKEVAALGQFANMKMVAKNEFACSSDIHPQAVDHSTLVVTLYDKSTGSEVAVFSADCPGKECPKGAAGTVAYKIKMQGDGTYPHGLVTVRASQLDAVIKANPGKDLEARISFMTRTDVDPKTGLSLKAPAKKKSKK